MKSETAKNSASRGWLRACSGCNLRPSILLSAWREESASSRRTSNLLHMQLKPAGRKLGMPWLNWHTLRRTHATLLQHAGATLREAQAQLGHSKMSTTLELYTISIPA